MSNSTSTSSIQFTVSFKHLNTKILPLMVLFFLFNIGKSALFAQITEEDEMDFIMQVDKKEGPSLTFGVYTNSLMLLTGKANLGLSAQFGGFHEIYSSVGVGYFPAFYDGLFTQGSLNKALDNTSHFFVEAGYAHYFDNKYLNFAYTGFYAEASLKYLYEDFGGITVESRSHDYAGIKIGGGYSINLSERRLKLFGLKLGGSLDVLGKISSSNSSGNNTIVIPRAVVSILKRFN